MGRQKLTVTAPEDGEIGQRPERRDGGDDEHDADRPQGFSLAFHELAIVG